MKTVTSFIVLLLCFSVMIQAEEEPLIQVKVTVTNQLPDDRFTENWPVHIYLTTPGSKIPLSATTTRVTELPHSTVLTEKNYVIPTFTLKGQKHLELVTKISSSGDPHIVGPEDYRKTSRTFTLDPQNRAQIEMILE